MAEGMDETRKPPIENGSAAAVGLTAPAAPQVPCGPLVESADIDEVLRRPVVDEEAWIEVIRKMDAVYAELVESQAELERKNAELEEAQRFISRVLGSMTDVLVVCDTEGRIQRVNEAMLRLTGWREEELLGRSLVELFTEGHRDKAGLLASRARGLEGPVTDCEVSLRAKDGSPVELAVNCSTCLDHAGRATGLVLVGRPVGELQHAYRELARAHEALRKMQQQLVFSEKMAALGRLVAGVAHELNNPISFIYGNMHALERYAQRLETWLRAVDDKVRDEELRRLRDELQLERILKDLRPLVEGTLEGAERVSAIVQELRRFSGRQREERASCALRPLVETAVNWVSRSTPEMPRVGIDCPEDLRVHVPRGHVHQILVNLLQNAVDVLAARRDGRIDITCGRDDGGRRAVLEVRDNGPGIAEADLPRIFEPFFTTKPIGKGTGLGLYVSYNMAGEIGGALEARNLPAGGAAFVLRLPLAEAQSGAGRGPAGEDASA